MVRQIGTKITLIGQRKSDKNVKTVYILNRTTNKFELAFEGNFDDMQKFINHLQDKENKKEYRKMIAEMSGTSYSATCRDMGIAKI